MNARARHLLFELGETLILTLVLFVGIQTFVARPYQVQQGSMEDTLLPDQYVLVDKLTPHFDAYARGDIVIFVPPGAASASTPYIKRVIGLPGDRIEIRDGHTFVNGHELLEPYLYPGETTEPRSAQSAWTVPAGSLFVLGDHRLVSDDSREFGPVPEAKVIGRAWLRYWPIGAFEVIATPTYPDLGHGGGTGA